VGTDFKIGQHREFTDSIPGFGSKLVIMVVAMCVI
jgi:hypothetical protein